MARRRCRWLRQIFFAGLLALVVPLMHAAEATSEAPDAAEYQLKAVFVFRFSQFAEWPERAFADKQAPLIIGILGEDPFGTYLDDLVKGEKIGQHPLQVRRFRDVKEAAGCHILFVSRSEAAQFGPIFSALQGQSILTLGDAEPFTRFGGMIRFVMESGKVRLRINVEAAKDVGLAISSKILRPSTIVTPEKG